MSEQNTSNLSEEQIAAALAGALDQAVPRRDLWPSIRAEVQRRQPTPRRRWLMSPFGSVTALVGRVLAVRPAGLALGSVAASLLLAWLLWSQPWQESLVRHGGEYWYTAHYDDSFKRQGVNPLVDTGDNVRCSLNVNVDTASYIKARRVVQDGRLPDPESVRVEEFINSFAQEYSSPVQDAFAVHIEGGPSHFGAEQPWLLRFGLQGRVLQTQERRVIARNVEAWIEFNPQVVSRYRQLGYEYPRVRRDTSTLVAGQVHAGHTATALWEVEFHEGATDSLVATAYVKYEDPNTGKERTISRGLDRSDFSTTFERASRRFQLNAVVAEYAEILRESYWARGSNLAEVRRQAQRVSALLPDDPDVTEFVYLVTQAQQINRQHYPIVPEA